MVKASASRAEDPGFVFLLCRGDFSRSNHVSDIKIKKNSTPVAILPGAWWYRVISGTGWSGVSILTERERGGGGRERERGREGERGGGREREREKENPMIPTSKERYMSYRRSRN